VLTEENELVAFPITPGCKVDTKLSSGFSDRIAKPQDTDGHGPHVAGVIAARGNGSMGIAPSVLLNIYRVFPRDGDGASNFDIAKATDMAVADGCDLVNMSISGSPWT
jgi:subtilisin family serine protease